MPRNIQKEKDLEDFASRLNERLDRMGYPLKSRGRQVQLAKDLNVDQKAVRRWLEGIGYPRDTNLKKLAAFISVSVSALKYDEVDHIQKASTMNIDSDMLQTDKTKASGKNVPIFALYEINDALKDHSERGHLPPVPLARDLKVGATLVEGTSMDDGTSQGYTHGNYIYWTLSKVGVTGDHVIAKLEDGTNIFRSLDKDSGRDVLRPLNPQYSIISTGFSIVAIVIGKYQPVASSATVE